MIGNTADYLVGIPSIDIQHERYVELIKKLLLAYGEKTLTKSNIVDYIDEINVYALEHLDTEEALMRAEKYPFYEKHLEKHNIFRGMLDKFIEELEIGEIDIDDYVNRLCDSLISWFKLELLRDDVLLARYLKKRGVGQA